MMGCERGHAGRRSRYFAAALMVAVVAACAVSRPSTSVGRAAASGAPPTFGSGAPVDAAVRFHGHRVAGSLYILAGPGPESGPMAFDTDVYLVKGAFAGARRLTYSVGSGFDGIAADGANVLVSDGRDPIVGDEIKQLRVRAGSARLGRTLGVGFLQALGPGGRYLSAVSYSVGKRNAGYWKVFEARLGHRGRRLVLRTATTRDGGPEPVAGWGLGGQVAILLGDRVILGAGTSAARSAPRLGGYIYLTGGGPGGMQALRGSGKIGLLSWSGRLRVIRTAWLPLCFSPDERDLLVVNPAWDRLGVMSVRAGRVSPLATVDGHFQPVAWVSSSM